MKMPDGVNLVESRYAPPPQPPTPGEWARRFVRHEFAKPGGVDLGGASVMEWLGRDVGPEPDDLVHIVLILGNGVQGAIMRPETAAVVRLS